MDLLFKSNSKENNKNPAVKVNKYILPVLVYIPIIIFLTIIGSFFGVKIYKYITDGEGIAKFLEKNIEKVFNMKDSINSFIKKTVETFWPDENAIIEGPKTYKHIRLDNILIFTGSLFILVMIVLYNYDYIKSFMVSKVNYAKHKAKNMKINKDKVINKGALISIGNPGKVYGTVAKVHSHITDEIESKEYYYDSFNNEYIPKNNQTMKSLNDEKGMRSTHYLYDISYNGNQKVVTKISSNVIKNDFYDTTKNNKNGKNANVGDGVYLHTKQNVYDHNVFNVYNTNKSVDFNKKSYKFVNRFNNDKSENINNWEAHIHIPKKGGVFLIKWGKIGIKKGIFSLSTKDDLSAFSLGIKGNGSDSTDPMNNYIFKDKNGKTYQALLENYGVKKIGDEAYDTNFKISYKIRETRSGSLDTIIYINDNFVMKIPDGGVPLNNIKWCGSPKNTHLASLESSENTEEYEVESMQYFVEKKKFCEKGSPTKINGIEYCVENCGIDNYYNLASNSCKTCPNGSETTKAFALLPDCKYPTCSGDKEYYDVFKKKCVEVSGNDVLTDEISKAAASKGWSINIDESSDILAAYPGLTSSIQNIDNNGFDKNNEVAEIIASMKSEIKDKIMKTGGIPLDNTKTVSDLDMPTLYVYQTKIKKNKNDYIPPEEQIQEGETGVFNRLFNSFAPFTWYKIKRNVKNNTPEIETRGIQKRNSTFIGGFALLIGFVIFTSLLVNQHNMEIKKAVPEKLKDVFIDRTSYYTFSIIFIGLALGLFSLLLFYAATSDVGSNFLSILIIVLSAVILLAAIAVLFKDKIDELFRSNPYIKFIYHSIFVLPCLFIDLVNYIYYEFKNSPKIVYIVFGIEVLVILSLLILPELRNRLYLYIFADKNKKKNIDIRIANLKLEIAKLENGIHQIQTFNPTKDSLKRISINSLNQVEVKKIKREENGNYVEDVTPENTDVFGIVYKYLFDKKEEIKTIVNKFNPLDISSPAPKMNGDTWDLIIKKKLYKKNNAAVRDLKNLLYDYGYKSSEECQKYNDVDERQRCYLILDKIIFHIQMNTPNIIIFSSTIKNIEKEIENLKEKKSNSSSFYEKGVIALNKPLYFRYRKVLPIKDFNKNQVHELKHNYSLSSWFFVHSQPPNFSNEYNRETEILSYNGEPTIYYYGKMNQLIIKTKKISKDARLGNNSILLLEDLKIEEENQKGKEMELEEAINDMNKFKKQYSSPKYIQIQSNINKKIDTHEKKIKKLEEKISVIKFNVLEIKKKLEDGKNDVIVLFKKEKFKLQKWHNLVVNYIGGTVDIFLDGELVASTNRVVSYKMYNRLTIGEDKKRKSAGIGGGICNVVYYPKYISKTKIQNNYNFFKNKNPPTI